MVNKLTLSSVDNVESSSNTATSETRPFTFQSILSEDGWSVDSMVLRLLTFLSFSALYVLLYTFYFHIVPLQVHIFSYVCYFSIFNCFLFLILICRCCCNKPISLWGLLKSQRWNRPGSVEVMMHGFRHWLLRVSTSCPGSRFQPSTSVSPVTHPVNKWIDARVNGVILLESLT